MKRVRIRTDKRRAESVHDMSIRQDTEATDMDAMFSSVLRDALHQVESIAPDSPPHLQFLSRLVEDTKLRQTRRLRRDLARFLAVAIFAGAGWMLSATLHMFADALVMTSLLSLAILPICFMLTRHEGGAS
ncbi:DUF5345 family protein [Alicyclobacillus fastidiosus]|uniref:DUF5345 family protein n=1 Tax=Alicyclobacillus fastidiosus TaxID=392011 RepID=A0ABV5AKW8_9BACL|nr:DUF5345 family protein [Alicyclobacillus fastidiosus]WEH08332.1 DUF5345 family protein [Alicyclobacillus fastidiosus]